MLGKTIFREFKIHNCLTDTPVQCFSHHSDTFASLTFLFQISQSQESPLPPSSSAKKRTAEIVWPIFHNNGVAFPTQFDADSGNWKCPFCDYSTPRIRQHLEKKHKDKDITNWESADNFCKEMVIAKRKETKRRADEKRAYDPKRKQVLRKADQKREPERAVDPKRKVVLRKAGKVADGKRAEDPKRKEVLLI